MLLFSIVLGVSFRGQNETSLRIKVPKELDHVVKKIYLITFNNILEKNSQFSEFEEVNSKRGKNIK